VWRRRGELPWRSVLYGGLLVYMGQYGVVVFGKLAIEVEMLSLTSIGHDVRGGK